MIYNDKPTNAWDLYWESGALESCITQSDRLAGLAMEAFWGGFAESLPKSAKIIDLATGNGSVVKQLLSSVSSLQVTAVDIAMIQPQTEDVHLASATFVPNIDITNLPYATCEFDAVTSQFGAEYAISDHTRTSEMVLESSRVLSSGGHLKFLMHNTQSALLLSNQAKLREYDSLFASSGLLPTLLKYKEGDASLYDMESAGETFLKLDIVKTKRISGQIFDAITYFLQQPRTKLLSEHITNTLRRIYAERSRLQQLQKAALSESEMIRIVDDFKACGVVIDISEPMLVANENGDKDILGWHILGQKR